MSEAESNWSLRHRDGVEHGPFRLVDLVSAASAGNIAEDTCVRHVKVTHGNWVFANRVPPIANAMTSAGGVATPAAPRAPASVAAPVPVNQTPPRSPGESIFRKPGNEPSAVPSDQTTATAESPQTAELDPANLPVRSRDDGYSVPKSFLDAVGVILGDFRFRRFATPWIVKILYAIAMLIAVLSILKLGYDFFVQPSMTAPGPPTASGGWEFEPIEGQPFLQTKAVIFVIYSSAVAIAILCLRLLFEIALVLFRAGGDLTEVQRFLRQQKK